MKIWIEKTKVKGNKERDRSGFRYGESIFSPAFGSDGRDSYKNMRNVDDGNIILHFIDNSEFDAVSIVNSKLEHLDDTPGYPNRAGHRYKLKNFQKLEHPLGRDLLLNDTNKYFLQRISQESEVFYQENLDLRQGAYLTPCPFDLFSKINAIYQDLTSINLPHYELAQAELSYEKFRLGIHEGILGFAADKGLDFKRVSKSIGLSFTKDLITRFLASLQAKPFVILSGLSGSGKTKLAESFATYISESEEQWMLVPVGADWTNRDSLLGFENTLTKSYSLPPYNVPKFIERASREENKDRPYFLILDEMNLSVVERYFADFLSAMEASNKEISLHQIERQANEKQKLLPKKLKLPPNLFIIGTVNIDESTYMFSPKVLDRANTIEFRLKETDVQDFLNMDLADLNLDELAGKGKEMAVSFLKNCRKEIDEDLIKTIDALLIETFKPLKKAGAEFGYRTISEIRQLSTQLNQFDIDSKKERSEADKFKQEEAIFDIAILQKLLPKLHGSVGKLKLPLTTLAELCFDEGKWDNQYLDANNVDGESSEYLRYPESFEKIKSMYVRLLQNGFVSFAEA